MKKVVLPLLMLCLATAGLSAQETSKNSNDFNKWSIDINGGINKAANPFDQGYHMNATNLFHADLGFRYMFNTKFGLKLAGGYDVFNDDGDHSLEFKTTMYSANLQGYANLGRIMEFETWTQRINVLGHLGVGIAGFQNDNFDGTDRLGSFLMGMTLQYRISNKIALNGDFTMMNNFSQQKTWNGGNYNPSPRQGFDSTNYSATLGLSIYLGKHEKHADWFVDQKSDELEDLENRIGELETMMNDTDRDGVPDYLDAEPNTITGVAVDSKGRTIDKNNNGVPDELESYIDNKNQQVKQEIKEENNASAADLINGGYVNVYFDFNKDQPNAQSVSGINFLIKYLKENPSTSADVIGYADEIGPSAYNDDLSKRRAENVKKILVDAGIDASRLNIVGNGEDNSVNKDSKYARQVVRRVTFILK